MSILHWQTQGQHILYRDDLQPLSDTCPFNVELFDANKLQHGNKVYRTAQGRGTSYFFKVNQEDWVLRHYWRGGLVGKFRKNAYWWKPLKKTRPFLELSLLDSLQQLKLPAPKAIAGRVCYQGWFYRADIITGTICRSHSLTQCLREPLDLELWQSIGQTIAQFHRHNIYHADLNAHNILIDEQQQVFLIDFDKGKQMPANTGSQWKQQNLDRLLRSLNKEKSLATLTHFGEQEWQYLLEGYHL